MVYSKILQEIEDSTEEFLTKLAEWKKDEIEGRETASMSSIYDGYPFLSDPGTFEELMNAPVGPEDEIGLKNLMGALAEHNCMRPFIEAEDEISRISESSLIPMEEEEVPYPASEAWLMQQKSGDLRQAVENGRKKVIQEIDSYLSQAHERAYERCIELGFTGMEHLWQYIRGIDFRKLKESSEELLSETQDTFSDHLRWISQRRAALDPKKLKRHDMLYIFASNEYNRLFPHRNPEELLLDTLTEMNLPWREMSNLQMQAGEGDGGPTQPLCLPMKVPGKVLLYCPPVGGLNHYISLFSELGRGLFYSHIQPDLPFRRRLGEPAIPQTHAFLFGSLLRDPLWLRRHLDIEMEPDLIRSAYFEKLYSVRAQAGRFIYELEIHSGTPAGEGSLFRESMHHATGVDYPQERRLMDIPPWFKGATNLSAWNLEAGLRRRLREEFNEDWFRNPDAGEFLKACWAGGFSETLENVAQKWGFSTSEMTPLIEDFHQHLA